MTAKDPQKKIKIEITTYVKQPKSKRSDMNKPPCCRTDRTSRFICSICLNTNVKKEDSKILDKGKSRSCPVCQGTSDANTINSCENFTDKPVDILDDKITKNVQTSRTNIDQVHLLNEVLTVFQSKKDYKEKESCNKTIMMKDACVSAEFDTSNRKARLSISKVFQLSIDECGVQETGKFAIVYSCQPKARSHSQYSIDLIKHKSSSIPQMKMEELRNYLKEKTKTNNPIDEVNRMFATVKRDDSFNDNNRPMTRNGPRVLPVVKTNAFLQSQRQSDEDITERCNCGRSNYYMSSGDSLEKQERCERSNQPQCCHKNHQDIQTKVHICDHCRKSFDRSGNRRVKNC